MVFSANFEMFQGGIKIKIAKCFGDRIPIHSLHKVSFLCRQHIYSVLQIRWIHKLTKTSTSGVPNAPDWISQWTLF
jgi:hypothetical protein